MLSVKTRSDPPLDRNTVTSLNKRTAPPVDSRTAARLNRSTPVGDVPPASRTAQSPPASPAARQPQAAARPQPAPAQPAAAPAAPKPRSMVIPMLSRPLQKGQKAPLEHGGGPIRVCVGWNIKDARCDIDVSAFLVDDSQHVPGDDWFVFYGHPASPDGSVHFYGDPVGADREILEIDFRKLNPNITRIIFVLTIHEAFRQRLNFSMVQDAYLRILEGTGQKELLSFRLTDYYENVTSMTIGELYHRNGQWRFNAVGNGVHQDLAGQCAIYGVSAG